MVRHTGRCRVRRDGGVFERVEQVQRGLPKTHSRHRPEAAGSDQDQGGEREGEMTFTEHQIEQRTPEWHALRCGRLCGSKAADMLATISKGEAAGRRNLRMQLMLERITRKPQ